MLGTKTAVFLVRRWRWWYTVLRWLETHIMLTLLKLYGLLHILEIEVLVEWRWGREGRLQRWSASRVSH